MAGRRRDSVPVSSLESDGAEPSGVVVSCVAFLGDLALASLAFDHLRERYRSVAVLVAPATAGLVVDDSRLSSVVPVSTSALGWRIGVFLELLRARREGRSVLNLEVYRPRWAFVRATAAQLGLRASSLDLDALVDDERRSSSGRPTRLVHRASHFAAAAGLSPDDPPIPRLLPDPHLVVAARKRLAAAGVPETQSVVAVHVGSREAERRPPSVSSVPASRPSRATGP